ncbi:hypothetical protein [Desulfolutivibrio sp.]|uniref:hypothetical protein n=1 Tax=Desulfolutivibrio sp. TaxID=2773296 RepID=UPI002F961282
MKATGHVVRGSVVFLAFLSLALGGMMYIALRQDTPVFAVFLADIGFEGWIAAFRRTFASFRKILPDVLLYSAPNAFWSFSYTLIMMDIWWQDTSRARHFWLATTPVVVFGWELLQYRRLAPGTGCPEDLIFSFLGLSAGFLMIVYLKRRTYANGNN